ncbi:MAG: phosphoribosylformylglycinamidine synthase subunit PurQ [Melioribacteraceae bacterium]|nr:phosphoribosylformylglycinamidine synthase subunit PurQ [Melioribacteraceae bacterium]MCO6474405.1 phosphoribosylformylglycinamidine synthase subunit PurQ [Melioribacteraceae bacterium]
MKPKFGVVVFPGSNCDHDAYYVAKKLLGYETEFLWHKERDLKNSDIIILPGGFSYGDYLRTGAIARFSPVMNSVIDFANKGGIVIGICNGFQILLEAGLLPGVLMQNKSLKFICKDVNLKVVNKVTIFTQDIDKNVLTIPIAHGDGQYFAEDDVIKSLQDNDQIVFQYSDENGNVDESSNPNGSVLNIAGIVNKKKNILGMMPHPERCSDKVLNNTDGLEIFSSTIKNINNLIEV